MMSYFCNPLETIVPALKQTSSNRQVGANPAKMGDRLHPHSTAPNLHLILFARSAHFFLFFGEHGTWTKSSYRSKQALKPPTILPSSKQCTSPNGHYRFQNTCLSSWPNLMTSSEQSTSTNLLHKSPTRPQAANIFSAQPIHPPSHPTSPYTQPVSTEPSLPH